MIAYIFEKTVKEICYIGGLLQTLSYIKVQTLIAKMCHLLSVINCHGEVACSLRCNLHV